MPYRTNLIYYYDGTYSGFLCCVFECFRAKEMPLEIRREEEEQQTLYGAKEILTQPELARRVDRSISEKISPQAHRLVRAGFLTCLEDREMLLLRFLLMGYRHGAQVTRWVTREPVHTLNHAVRALRNEAHHTLEFLRFSQCQGFLAAQIAPKNAVLPLIVPHFCDRLPSENFMIFDRVHGMGFVHKETGERKFFQADQVELPPPSEREKEWRALWKAFYKTIAVEGRENHKLRQNLMPKHYWPWMTEFQGEES